MALQSQSNEEIFNPTSSHWNCETLKHNISVFFTTLCLAATACNQAHLDDIDLGEAGTDSDGPDHTVTPDGVIEDGCLSSRREGVTGYVHQCSGSAFAYVNFTVDTALDAYSGPKSLLLWLRFGPKASGDSYEKPKVMACCSPIDNDAPFPLQPHHRACFNDLIENGCRSLFHKLGEIIEDAPIVARPQLRELQTWVGDHQQECYDEFYRDGGLADYEAVNEYDHFYLNHTWVLPKSAWTKNFKNIELQIRNGMISDAHIPDKKLERLTCEGQDYNNDEFFRVAKPREGFNYELVEGHARLQSPRNGTSPHVSASAHLASAATGCSLCSTASLQQVDKNIVRLDALVFDSSSSTKMRWGDEDMKIDRFRAALYAPVDAKKTGADRYQIPAGSALFLVSAMVDGHPESVLLPNQAPIELVRDTVNDRWTLGAVTLSTVDFGGTWSLSLSNTTWE